MLKTALVAVLVVQAGVVVQAGEFSLSAGADAIPLLPTAAPQLLAPQAMLFDWDGTIVDESAAWHAVLGETAKSLGLPAPPKAEAEKTWVTQRPAFFEKYFPGKEPALVKNTFIELMGLARGGAEIGGRRFDGVEILPGAVDVLDAVKERGIPMAVVSNKPQAQLDAEMRKTGLRHYFVYVQGHGAGREAKPSPQPILEALNVLGVSRETAWYVGNEPVDIQAALGSGARGVLVDPRWKSVVAGRHAVEDANGGILYVDGHAGLKLVIESLPRKHQDHPAE